MLADVIAFNAKNEARAMPYFKQETLESSQAKGGLDSKEYLDALEKGTSARKIIDDLMLKHRLLSLAYGYEQASKKRVAPEFKPTLLPA